MAETDQQVPVVPTRRSTGDRDIANETYHGPNQVSSAFGEATVAHWVALFGGAGAGGLLGWLAPGVVRNVEKGFQSFKDFGEGKNFLIRWPANLAGRFSEFSKKKGSEIVKYVERNKFRLPANEADAIIFGGGVAGVLGFISAGLLWGDRGARKARQAHHQFERAKEEIITQRAEYDDLRQKYVDTKTDLEDARATNAALTAERNAAPQPSVDAIKETAPVAQADIAADATPAKDAAASIAESAPTGADAATTLAKDIAPEKPLADTAPQETAALTEVPQHKVHASSIAHHAVTTLKAAPSLAAGTPA